MKTDFYIKRTRVITAVLLVLSMMALAMTSIAEEIEYKELSKGSKGKAVKELKVRLKELGYLSSSADNTYSSNTASAVLSFQARNGLEQNGIATVEMQKLLFSDEARKAPADPPVYPKSVTMRQKCWYYVYNNSGEKIDNVKALCVPFGSDGKVISDKAISFEYNLLTKDWGVHETISNKSKGMHIYVNDEYAGWETKTAKSFAIGIVSYHTASGNTVVFAPDDVTYYYTDGRIKYPENDPEPYIYSDEESAKIAEVRTGLTLKNIYPFTAEFYGTKQGLYVLDVAGNSLGDRAGFKAGDIITSMDGKPSILVPTQHEAARKLLNGETVEYTYIRNGRENSVGVSMNMEPVMVEVSTNSALSIADELLKYGELLERGLITQEEYDALKKKLIFE